MWGQASRTVASGEYARPKTVLGFLGVALLIVVSGTFAVVTVLADESSFRGLLIAVLAFAAVVILGVIGGVFAIVARDPTKLMLGEMTGHDYVEYRRLTLGDSESGEHLEPFVRSGQEVPASSEGPKELPTTIEEE